LGLIIADEIQELLNTLQKNGYKSYLVGQTVADLLLHEEPQSWEIATDASLADLNCLFWQTFSTAAKDDSLTIVVWQKAMEVCSIKGKSLIDYLAAQNFTLEALAYDWKEKRICDYDAALDKLEKKIIALIENKKILLEQKPILMLKAIRLAAQYQFDLSLDLWQTIKEKSQLLQTAPLNKVRDELALIILAPKPSFYLQKLAETDILNIFLPELDKALQYQIDEEYNLGIHLFQTIDNLPANLELRLAGLFHDLGKLDVQSVKHKEEVFFSGHEDYSTVAAKKILDRLNLFMKVTGHGVNHHLILNLIRNHMFSYNPKTTTDKGIERLISRIGIENIHLLLSLRKANILAGSQAQQSKMSYYYSLKKRVKKYLQNL